jgi:hypothetical protein
MCLSFRIQLGTAILVYVPVESPRYASYRISLTLTLSVLQLCAIVLRLEYS